MNDALTHDDVYLMVKLAVAAGFGIGGLFVVFIVHVFKDTP